MPKLEVIGYWDGPLSGLLLDDDDQLWFFDMIGDSPGDRDQRRYRAWKLSHAPTEEQLSARSWHPDRDPDDEFTEERFKDCDEVDLPVSQVADVTCEPCKAEDHENCPRTLGTHDCVCYLADVAGHARLFHMKAQWKMMESLQEAGFIVVMPGEPLPTYQLYLGGTRWGQFLTEDGAKRAAQEELDELWKMHDETPEEDQDDYEPLVTRTLEWSNEHWSWAHHQVLEPDHEWFDQAPAIPYARCGETSAFVISTVEIQP